MKCNSLFPRSFFTILCATTSLFVSSLAMDAPLREGLFQIPNASQIENDTAAQLEEFYSLRGGRENFSQIFQDVSETVLHAEDEVAAGNFEDARARIDAIWAKYPRGSATIWRESDLTPSTPRSHHLFASGYYNLTKLDYITQIALDNPPRSSTPLTLTFVIADCLIGDVPTSADLTEFTRETRTINPLLVDNDYYALRQSYQLFQQYVWAISKGEKHLELEFQHVTDCIDIEGVNEEGNLRINEDLAIQELPDDVLDRADLFLYIYPSFSLPDYSTEYRTGGVRGFDGRRVMMNDDAFFVRRRTGQGGGVSTDVDRRIYLPTWNGHEYFAHVLFNIFRQHKLEAESHLWYRRFNWPDDFTGAMEADYHIQGLTKRFNNSATTPSDAIAFSKTRALKPNGCRVETFNNTGFINGSPALEIGTHSFVYFRNNMESLRIPENFIVTACDEDDGSGTCQTFTTSQSTLGDLNNKISHIDVAGTCAMGLSSATAPNRIQAESFTTQNGTQVMPERDSFHDVLGWIDNGDSASYTIDVLTAGDTKVTVRASSGNAAGGGIDVVLDGQTIGTMIIPFTGGWDDAEFFQEFTIPISIPEAAVGSGKTLTLNFTGDEHEMDELVLNWIEFSPIDPPVVNVALYKPTQQSSISSNGSPARAVDGNTDGTYTNLSVTHTSAGTDENPSWWEVDLEESTFITDIKLWNRTDEASAWRLHDISVFVSDFPFTGTTVDSSTNDPNVAKFAVGGTLGTETTISVNQAGRYVRIQHNQRDVLSLAEVEVFGIAEINLARGKTATQSTTNSNTPAGLAIDGTTDGIFNNGSVARTVGGSLANPAWWEVDLGEIKQLSALKIWNRTDSCCSDRLVDMHVFVSDYPFVGTSLLDSQDQAGVTHIRIPGVLDEQTDLSIGRTGRYVRIQRSDDIALVLAEVEVFGELGTVEATTLPDSVPQPTEPETTEPETTEPEPTEPEVPEPETTEPEIIEPEIPEPETTEPENVVPENVSDTDQDGVPDAVELAEQTNPDDALDYADSDADGIANFSDADSDGDGIINSQEPGRFPYYDRDGDGIPAYLDDNDYDVGIANEDNSVEVQFDPNGDGQAEFLSTNDDTLDSDGDQVPDTVEIYDGTDPSDRTDFADHDRDGLPDYIDADDDNDGIPDVIEGTFDADADSVVNQFDTDSDGDGVSDAVEGTADIDGNGLPNFLDVQTLDTIPQEDADADGIADSVEGSEDSDGDGVINSIDTDSDNDGIPDLTETNEDLDGDGVPNFLDDDSDGDGISDRDEGTVDTDGDGIEDFRSFDGNANQSFLNTQLRVGLGSGCVLTRAQSIDPTLSLLFLLAVAVLWRRKDLNDAGRSGCGR